MKEKYQFTKSIIIRKKKLVKGNLPSQLGGKNTLMKEKIPFFFPSNHKGNKVGRLKFDIPTLD